MSDQQQVLCSSPTIPGPAAVTQQDYLVLAHAACRCFWQQIQSRRVWGRPGWQPTSWNALYIGFCEGWTDNEVTPGVDDHPVAGSLVQDPQLASSCHNILHHPDSWAMRQAKHCQSSAWSCNTRLVVACWQAEISHSDASSQRSAVHDQGLAQGIMSVHSTWAP